MMNHSSRSALLALVTAVLMLALAGPAQAQSVSAIGSGKKVGLGIGHGTYTGGLTGKFYLDQPSAIQVFVGNFGGFGSWDYGYACGRYGAFRCGFSLSVDYIYEFENLVNESGVGRLFLGAGGGGYLFSYYGNPAAGFGVNGVFEIGWHFAEFPLEFVADIRPVLALNPGFFIFDGGAAVRIFF